MKVKELILRLMELDELDKDVKMRMVYRDNQGCSCRIEEYEVVHARLGGVISCEAASLISVKR